MCPLELASYSDITLTTRVLAAVGHHSVMGTLEQCHDETRASRSTCTRANINVR